MRRLFTSIRPSGNGAAFRRSAWVPALADRPLEGAMTSLTEAELGDVPSFVTTVMTVAARLRRRARHLLCPTINGGHELYRARSESKLFQQCLLCGYETPGWTIDRMDRRLHVVTQDGHQVGRRTGTR